MMPGATTGKIWARGGPFDGCGVSLLPGATTLGRDSLNDIVMENPAVSRRHARIQGNAQGYWIQDLGSRNGTFVNGQEVTRAPVMLNAEDEIKFGAQSGDTTWIFREVEISETHFENTQATMAISLEDIAEPLQEMTSSAPPADAPEPPPRHGNQAHANRSKRTKTAPGRAWNSQRSTCPLSRSR